MQISFFLIDWLQISLFFMEGKLEQKCHRVQFHAIGPSMLPLDHMLFYRTIYFKQLPPIFSLDHTSFYRTIDILHAIVSDFM